MAKNVEYLSELLERIGKTNNDTERGRAAGARIIQGRVGAIIQDYSK